jgi:acetylornithine deacetylase/succinyl-diaminopimelate desuccinylase-like protein
MHKTLKILLLIMASFLLSNKNSAQIIVQRDAIIEQMVKEVSADSLKAYITRLVSFGTRSTLSTTNNKQKGIGAAREWVVQKFNEFGKNSNGRLTAYVDTTTLQPDGKRVDVVTSLGNAMATLKGTDPADNRIYLISGHLDSRVSDVMNRTADAPGANDDASGVAAVIECARIMSRHAFPSTILFVAVSGEEQGLLGAEYLAAKAKKNNWNIDAMLNNDIIGSNNSNETNIVNNTRIRVFSEGLPFFELEKNATSIRILA